MILGQIAYIDCFVFLIFLFPQLFLRVSIFELLRVGLAALPFLCKAPLFFGKPAERAPNTFQVVQIPYQFFRERFLVSKAKRSLFVQQATSFEDFIIRIVRYAFARMPANIGISRLIRFLLLPQTHLHRSRVLLEACSIAIP